LTLTDVTDLQDVDVGTHPWHDRRHHATNGRFRNPWSEDGAREVPLVRGALWALKNQLRSKRNAPPPVAEPEPKRLREPPERLRVTWLGHVAALIQTPGLTLLTDPMFDERASPVPFAGPKRLAPTPLSISELPPIDGVLLSHDHYDHLSKASVRALRDHSDPLFLVPLGVKAILKRWGPSRVVEMDWWQFADVLGARFHCTPARHFSGRTLYNDQRTLWASWYVETEKADLYFGGDSARAPHFGAIRDHLGAPDTALLPIGAYTPRWLMAPIHVDPGEAWQAFRDLEAGSFIPIHWGTFDLAGEPVQEPPERLRQCAREDGMTDRLHVLDLGASVQPAPAAPAGERERAA
jgi:N-acyl-phosphatidylethanolamine-hydrolysing phospholipase D